MCPRCEKEMKMLDIDGVYVHIYVYMYGENGRIMGILNHISLLPSLSLFLSLSRASFFCV